MVVDIIAERAGVDQVQPGGNRRVTRVTIDFAAVGSLEVASHEVFTITGLVKALIIYRVTANLAGAGTIQFGDAGSTTQYAAARNVTEFDAGEVVRPGANAPTDTILSQEIILNGTNLTDTLIDGTDQGYELVGAVTSGGTIEAICYWTPLSADGLVAQGPLTTL